jgi:uroporphyrinogen-III synthase
MDEKVTLTSLRSMNIQPQESPLMVIVGKTAGLCRQRDKILFTGLDPYNCLVPGQLVHSPLIEIQPVGFDADIHQYDGVVFTSRQAVQIFCKQSLITKKQKIISIGLQTTKELKGYGYIADYEAKLPDSDSAAALIIDLKLKRVVYPCSNLSDNNIHRLPSVEKRVIYKTTARKQSKVKLARFSGIVFSSSSTVDAFFALYKTIPRHLVLYVYGKHTADSLIKKGYGANVQTVSPQ